MEMCLALSGRASLHGKSSLRIEQVRSDDQGWYECKVLMLEQQYDTFHNGSWVHLTVNGRSGSQTLSGNWVSKVQKRYRNLLENSTRKPQRCLTPGEFFGLCNWWFNPHALRYICAVPRWIIEAFCQPVKGMGNPLRMGPQRVTP